MIKTLLAVCFTLLAVDVSASVIIDSDEKGVRYRQSAYFILRSNTGPLFAMARGKLDYDAELFNQYAQKVAMIANFPQDGFSKAWMTDDSKAKAEIWENKADFDTKMSNMIEAAKALAETAASGADKAANFKAVGNLGRNCKACHDKYKND